MMGFRVSDARPARQPLGGAFLRVHSAYSAFGALFPGELNRVPGIPGRPEAYPFSRPVGTGALDARARSVGPVAAGKCVAALGHRLAGPWAGLGGGLALGLLPAVQFYLQEGRCRAVH